MDWKQESLLYNCLRCFKPLFQLLCGEHSGHIRSRETISRTRLASLLAQQVKNLPVIQETQQMRVWSLGREDPLKEGMATHSSILAWRISWTEKPGGLQSIVLQRASYLCFFFNLFIYFNWRLITLQYCGGFCHTFTWISHGCTCVPHPEPPSHLPPHPTLRVIPVHQPWAPCLMHQTWTGNLFHIW